MPGVKNKLLALQFEHTELVSRGLYWLVSACEVVAYVDLICAMLKALILVL